jgi:ubiquinone biosynthesis protein
MMRCAKVVRVLGETAVRSRFQRPVEVARWVRPMLVEMGPAWCKLAQVASTRPDALGADVCDELGKLRDKVPPMSAAELEVVRADMEAAAARAGYRVARFDEAPMASATIGQVHSARLAPLSAGGDDVEVAVKLRRPYVRREILQDLHMLRSLLTWARADERAYWNELVDELATTLEGEMDMEREARVMQEFRRASSSSPLVRVPRPIAAACAPGVLVMERVEGFRSLVDGVDGLPLEKRAELADLLMSTFASQIMDVGLVHADPHPGNVALVDGEALVLFDFGNVLRLSLRERDSIRALMWQMAARDDAGAARTLIEDLGATTGDRRRLVSLMASCRDYAQDMSWTGASDDDSTRLPPHLFRLIRACCLLEGTCRQLVRGWSWSKFFEKHASQVLLDPSFMERRVWTDLLAIDQWARNR